MFNFTLIQMKLKFVTTSCMLALCGVMFGQDTDSLRHEQMQEIVVSGVRAQISAPYAVSMINRKELDNFSKTGKELPFLFSRVPGIISWSENGVGVGTSSMRIRGAGGSRINVTIDGIPLNSPEDQTVFWANMNSYGSLLGSVQIQRGVGSSTNGDGAFGGTISLATKSSPLKPIAELSYSYGSYNTMNMGGNLSTGLFWKNMALDLAYHETHTDGYMHGTEARSGSYYAGLSWIDNKFILSYKNIGNFERTGQAWNGVTAGNGDLSLMDGNYCDANWAYDQPTGIIDYEDLYNAGLGRYNDLYEYLVTDADGLFIKDEHGNYLTERYTMSDGSYWKKTTDNFRQNHNILSLSWTPSQNWKAAAAVRYTYGYGYYDEFRHNNKLKKFGLSDFIDETGRTIKKSDFVRKKGLSQNTYGFVANANYTDKDWDIVFGLSFQAFSGNHFGYLTYVSNPSLRNHLLANGDYKYYDSDADKQDGMIFIKSLYHINKNFHAFVDLQYRQLNYSTDGYNDKFIDNGDGTYSKHYLDINKKYSFWNPKIGLSYYFKNNKIYASLALSHREPERNNFTDNGNYPAPQPERVIDYEAGWQYSSKDYHFNINLYYMDYRNQFVQTGAVSDIGENLTTNIKRSYRAGVEFACGANITPWLSLEANSALSRNRIKNFDEIVEDWDNGFQTIHHDNSHLAFSPSFVSNGFIDFHYKGLNATWHSQYVGRQYLDNSNCKKRSLPEYSVENIRVSYSLKSLNKIGIREAVFSLDWNNIFNRHYAACGWVYSAIAESLGHDNDNRYYQIGFMPMAGSTIMGGVTLKF